MKATEASSLEQMQRRLSPPFVQAKEGATLSPIQRKRVASSDHGLSGDTLDTAAEDRLWSIGADGRLREPSGAGLKGGLFDFSKFRDVV